ncbi:MAG: hypothetical protein PHY29_02815 [Syntrophales bacterium]|nr:hypothetical protein [Syntrophales bacterium]
MKSEKQKEADRVYQRKYRVTHAEEERKRQRLWRTRNPAKVSSIRIGVRDRKIRWLELYLDTAKRASKISRRKSKALSS